MDISTCQRYVTYFLRWIFMEKIRGLDFSMRCKTFHIITKGNNGYALTPDKAINEMFDQIPISEQDRFLDIGCGKGGVLYAATKRSFGRIAGIEIEPYLCQVATKNIRKLRLENRIELFQADAVEFDRYNEFNVFYLWNPFELDIYEKVLLRVFDCVESNAMEGRAVWLICYGKSAHETIKASGLFKLEKQYTDPCKKNNVLIWRSNVGCSSKADTYAKG